MTNTDRIEKTIVLRAPQARVWRALTDAREFGVWFRVAFDGEFRAGESVRGHITYPGYEHLTFEAWIDELDAATQRFAFRWHPYAVDPAVDYSQEPTTQVVFVLASVPEGTRLTVTESGFDRLPLGRRDEAFRMNGNGWAAQLENIKAHVES